MTKPKAKADPPTDPPAELPGQLALDVAPPAADQPTPIAAGTFAIYLLPDGGALLVTGMDDGAGGIKEDRKVIPAIVMKMVRGGGGPFGRKLRGVFGAGDPEPAELVDAEDGS